jgi:hypothetical protein
VKTWVNWQHISNLFHYRLTSRAVARLARLLIRPCLYRPKFNLFSFDAKNSRTARADSAQLKRKNKILILVERILEARIDAPGLSMWDLWRTKWHCDSYFPRVLRFCPVSIIRLGLHIQISPGGWTIVPLVAAIRRQSHRINTNNNNKDNRDWISLLYHGSRRKNGSSVHNFGEVPSATWNAEKELGIIILNLLLGNSW